MKIFSIILVCFIANCSFAQRIYQSNTSVIHLKEDNSFIYYPNEASLKTLIAGAYILHDDSLILSTHQMDNETAIFAIYQMSEMQLRLIYAQKEFYGSLAKDLLLHQTLHANGKIKDDYYWIDKAKGSYSHYQFSTEGYFKSVLNYNDFRLDGKQLYFYPSQQSALQKELNYKLGVLDGNAYYYEVMDEEAGKLAMVLKEKYKNGKLVKTKKLATPPVFYTIRF